MTKSDSTPAATSALELPDTCLPAWGVADLPEPPTLSWRHGLRFIGPGLVMMGIQIGGGEWLFGPEITARYGGGLMWIATVAIVLQVFYNLECGRYALYCGEPIFTGFMRSRPGPMFWMGFVLLLNLGALIPGLSTHAAAMVASLILDRPPLEVDKALVTWLAYLLLVVAVLPVLAGGKVYNMLQWVMTTKVVVVLGFCLAIGVLCVAPANWGKIFGGFLRLGTVPTIAADGQETTVNLFAHRLSEGTWPIIALGNIAVLGAFAGYAGGGGLANATYSNFVRDKGWGMGSSVGAIPSAVGGRRVTLSHLGKVFPTTHENLQRWRGWWRYVLADQVFIWGPGCVMGMALPALLSLQFAPHSSIGKQGLEWSQALITADGIRHAPQFSSLSAAWLWTITVLVGLLVMLPSQMSIVDDFSRRWTDILWSGSRRVRDNLSGNQVRLIYYTILGLYVLWSLVCAYLFSSYGTPKLMTVVIANLNNLAIGLTAVHLLWINSTLLPAKIRPRWYSRLGVAGCAVFYLGLALLVFIHKQVPEIMKLFNASGAWSRPNLDSGALFVTATTTTLFDLAGLVAVVSGAARGMGRAMSLALAEHGADLLLVDRNAEGLAQTARDVHGLGRRAVTAVCDVSKPDEIVPLFARLDDEFGRIDFLANMAGEGLLAAPEEISIDELRTVLENLVVGRFCMCQEAGRRMLRARRGSIVNIGSLASVTALGRGHIAYSMAMGAVAQMTRELSTEWAGSGVRVNAILPAQVVNPSLERRMAADPAMKNVWLRGIPAGRLGHPDDIRGLAVLLASDASSWITGALIPMDGGNLALNGGGSIRGATQSIM